MATTPRTGNAHVETSHHPRTDPEREGRDYYGIPPIKEHTWTWEVPIYFWLGGIGAGTHLISTLAQLLGWKDLAFFRTARYTVLVTMILSPILLIMDLGRPERFYNMLRIVKLRSPMSTGSWALTIFGGLSGLIAAAQAARDGLLGRDNILVRLVKTFIPDRLLSVVALPVGLYVGLYSGILISATSVPMWARNFLLMGPTFLSSGLSTGLSAISFILHLGDWGERKTLEALRRTERVALVIEGALLAASLIRMGRWGKPLFSKKLAPLFLGGAIVGGILAPLALLSGRESRSRGLLASVLALLGGLALRFAMIEGGRLSARDPQATFTFAKGENLPISEDEV
ncbi:MAG TPA: NrfD/PsrC family molybdoenzyme membrane anchor subunit [Rubrobacteraceae bacterium]|jgi:formate-dependent nitrite reductase membrane component NrfD|nr:NrfD/PsrC family molybdoenzyme membrane anchor subunit [Rubrobacteraceae bacterium]